MKTLTVSTILAASTASIAVPSSFLLSEASTDNDLKVVQKKRWVPELTTIEKIKKSHKNNDCFTHYSWEIYPWEETETLESSPTFDLENIRNSDIESCLMVEYYKQTYTNSKWSGDFKLIWTLGSSFEKLVTIFNSKTEKGKLSIDYGAYVIKMSVDKWVAKYKKEDSVNSNSLPEWLPKSGKAISGFSNENYWDFFTDLEKICGDEECNENSAKVPTQVSNAWGWKMGSGSVKITDWNKDFDSWLDILFPNLTKAKTQIKSISNGTWTKKR